MPVSALESQSTATNVPDSATKLGNIPNESQVIQPNPGPRHLAPGTSYPHARRVINMTRVVMRPLYYLTKTTREADQRMEKCMNDVKYNNLCDAQTTHRFRRVGQGQIFYIHVPGHVQSALSPLLGVALILLGVVLLGLVLPGFALSTTIASQYVRGNSCDWEVSDRDFIYGF